LSAALNGNKQICSLSVHRPSSLPFVAVAPRLRAVIAEDRAILKKNWRNDEQRVGGVHARSRACANYIDGKGIPEQSWRPFKPAALIQYEVNNDPPFKLD